jgi:tetratricopeptide (TPR) repeat protein
VSRPDRAKTLLEEYRGKLSPDEREDLNTRFDLESLVGDIQLADGNARDAVVTYQSACEPFRGAFAICDASPLVAEAYDRAGEPDSAAALYDRYLAVEASTRINEAAWYPRSLRRAGQLHESKGNRAKALEYYGRFVDLWKDADPELLAQVRETRSWILRLTEARR